MNRLQRVKFIPNDFLDIKRQELATEFDNIFDQVIICEKGSREHRILLRQADIINNRTRKLLEDNHFYFTQKRLHLMNSSNLGSIPQTLPRDKEETLIQQRMGGIF